MAVIHVTKHHGIAIVTLNRPEKRNAMSFSLLKQLVKTAQQLKQDRDLRCVILTGEAHIFSAGIDLHDLNNPRHMAYAVWEQLKPGQSLFQRACLIWQELPVPVIAAIEGYCFGAGMQLALAADFRIAHPTTQMSVMESRWGLVPDMGLTQALRGLVPLDIAKELTFTGRIFTAQHAKELGLVTHLHEQPLDQALELAGQISQRSPDAIFAAKRVLDAMIHRPDKSLRLEKIWQLKLLLGKNSKLARQKDRHPEIQFASRQFK